MPLPNNVADRLVAAIGQEETFNTRLIEREATIFVSERKLAFTDEIDVVYEIVRGVEPPQDPLGTPYFLALIPTFMLFK